MIERNRKGRGGKGTYEKRVREMEGRGWNGKSEGRERKRG